MRITELNSLDEQQFLNDLVEKVKCYFKELSILKTDKDIKVVRSTTQLGDGWDINILLAKLQEFYKLPAERISTSSWNASTYSIWNLLSIDLISLPSYEGIDLSSRIEIFKNWFKENIPVDAMCGMYIEDWDNPYFYFCALRELEGRASIEYLVESKLKEIVGDNIVYAIESDHTHLNQHEEIRWIDKILKNGKMLEQIQNCNLKASYTTKMGRYREEADRTYIRDPISASTMEAMGAIKVLRSVLVDGRYKILVYQDGSIVKETGCDHYPYEDIEYSYIIAKKLYAEWCNLKLDKPVDVYPIECIHHDELALFFTHE